MKNKTELDTSFVTIADVFKLNGYISVSIGKWHLGEGVLAGPTGQGFNVNVAGWHKSYFSPYKNPCLSDSPKGECLIDCFTSEAVKFIKEIKNLTFASSLPRLQ